MIWRAATFLFCLLAASAYGQPISGIVPLSPYVAPCDISGVTCAEAYSVDRAMTSAYNGKLFQLIRVSDSTTLDVGQTPAHVVDMSGIAAFCANTTCNYSKVYGQIGGSVISAPASTLGASKCSSVATCAPPYVVDIGTGLPIVRHVYPTQLYSGSAVAAVTGGTSAVSIFDYGRTEGWSTCCGDFLGLGHVESTSYSHGTDFIPLLAWGQAPSQQQCATTSTGCTGIDQENASYAYVNQSDYTPNANQDLALMITWDGAGGTNTNKLYFNSATPLISNTPLGCSDSSGNTTFYCTTLNVGTYVRVGGGGDGTPADAIWREGLISNAVLSGANFTALQANETGFFGARSPSPCNSDGNLAYVWSTSDGQSAANNPGAITTAYLAYALRLMRPDYTGPIAALRDSAGTTHTYGSVGCGLDPAAATFCAANPPCTVSTLYNQGTYSTYGTPGLHDATLDLVQATVASQPAVAFAALNGQPVLTFAGSQSLCATPSGTVGSHAATLVSVVAKRTGGFSSAQTAFGFGGNGLGVGFSTANLAHANFGASSSGAATDSVYHSIAMENVTTSALYVDGVSVATSSAEFPQMDTPICMGNDTGSSTPFTGNLAEAIAISAVEPQSTATYNVFSQQAVMFAAQETALGSLPH